MGGGAASGILSNIFPVWRGLLLGMIWENQTSKHHIDPSCIFDSLMTFFTAENVFNRDRSSQFNSERLSERRSSHIKKDYEQKGFGEK